MWTFEVYTYGYFDQDIKSKFYLIGLIKYLIYKIKNHDYNPQLRNVTYNRNEGK